MANFFKNKNMITDIWSLLEKKQKIFFVFLFFFNILVLSLELVSLSVIFPIIYSLNNDLALLDKYEYLKIALEISNLLWISLVSRNLSI